MTALDNTCHLTEQLWEYHSQNKGWLSHVQFSFTMLKIEKVALPIVLAAYDTKKWLITTFNKEYLSPSHFLVLNLKLKPTEFSFQMNGWFHHVGNNSIAEVQFSNIYHKPRLGTDVISSYFVKPRYNGGWVLFCPLFLPCVHCITIWSFSFLGSSAGRH